MEVLVEGFEPGRQLHPSLAVIIQGGSAVVNIGHFRALHEGMEQVLVGWVERVVDLEAAAGFGEQPANVYLLSEVPRVTYR